MSVPAYLRILLLSQASAAALLSQADARDIIRDAIAADERNWRIARNYTFLQRVELRRLDSHGRVKSAEVQTYDVSLQEGTPYRQLVERNDRPLPAAEEKKERDSLARSIALRRQETATERAKRLSAHDKPPDWLRDLWRDLPDAFEFRLAGEEIQGGRGIFILDATPRPGYKPRSRTAKVFSSVKGRFWVDRQDRQVVRVQVEAIDTIAVGLFLVRVAKGSRAALDQTSVGDGIWRPGRLQVFASARLGLVKALRIEQDVHYSQYGSVPAEAGGNHPAEGRAAGMNPLARAASP